MSSRATASARAPAYAIFATSHPPGLVARRGGWPSGAEAPETDESAFALSDNALTANAGAVSTYRIDGTLITTIAEGETATLSAGLYVITGALGRPHKISVR